MIGFRILFVVFKGMGPDYRLLVRKARKIAQQYWLSYREEIPASQLVQRIAMVMQEYTQSGYVPTSKFFFLQYCVPFSP
jgi:20S proteasome alpha/beta subunit